MRNLLDQYLNSGWSPTETPPTVLRRVRTLTAASSLLLVLAVPFLIRAYEWQISVRMVTVPVAMAVALVALVWLRVSRRIEAISHLAVLAVYIAGAGGIITAGGLATVTMGWWLLVPLLAGILLDLRGGLIWGVTVLLSCYGLFWLEQSGMMSFVDQTPSQYRASQSLIQSFGLVSAMLVLMSSFMWQIGYSERMLSEQNKDLVRQIQRAEEAERETQKAVQAKTQFLANMSHELKTPLNSILGFSRRLQGKVTEKLDERESSALQLVSRHGEHMLYLVDDLLELSQIDQKELILRRSPVNVQEMLTRVVGDLASLAEHYNLQINVSVPEHLELACDGTRITQVLSNLMRHCVKYADCGPIRVQAYEGEGRCIYIEMDCPSVPLADREVIRMFDRYNHLHSRVDRDVGCSGLSLPLAAELVQLHGGELTVKVNNHNELQFQLRLPMI